MNCFMTEGIQTQMTVLSYNMHFVETCIKREDSTYIELDITHIITQRNNAKQ